MSVRGFILACLFPLPAITVHYTLKIWKRRCGNLACLDGDKSETIELSEMQFEVKTENIMKETNERRAHWFHIGKHQMLQTKVNQQILK